VVKRAIDAVAAKAPRVSVVLKADIRPGATGALTAKMESLSANWAADRVRANRPRGPAGRLRRAASGLVEQVQAAASGRAARSRNPPLTRSAARRPVAQATR
jgi:hypothetical protein